MGIEWANSLSLAQWAVLAAIPAAIVALYFLKLKRRRVVVPSTYLWRKSIEDLHVNSLWQRLRRSLLLLLQLLLVALLILALANPSWQQSRQTTGRSVLLIDNSASMGATDVEMNRLAEAKRRALDIIDALAGDDTAMVISFNDSAQIVQSFTNNRQQLRRALDSIRLSDSATNLDEAIRMASGLATPRRDENTTDEAAKEDPSKSETPTSRLLIFSDGEFPEPSESSLATLEGANLSTELVAIGTTEPANVGIISAGLDRGRPSSSRSSRSKQRLFARLENFGPRPTTATMSLLLDGELIDASTVALPAHQSSGVAFELSDTTEGVLELRAEVPAEFDQLAIDNRAWVPINPPRRARVLVVTAGDEPLLAAMRTERANELAEVTTINPDELAGESYRTQATSGAYDLIVYDRCQPPEMPQANTLFLGSLPKAGWTAEAEVSAPQIIDVDIAHPLMHLVEMSDVLIASAQPLKPPKASTTLIDSNDGPLLAIAPRDEFEDTVLGLAVAGGGRAQTNWPLRLSFPVFVLNVLEYFGPSTDALSTGIVAPGATVTLQSDNIGKTVQVRGPEGNDVDATGDRRHAISFIAPKVGVYEVSTAGQVTGRVAADLLNPAESRIARQEIESLGNSQVKLSAGNSWEVTRREGWKLLVVAALAILLIEWYIFNRRAFI